jgi:hypothetical protein
LAGRNEYPRYFFDSAAFLTLDNNLYNDYGLAVAGRDSFINNKLEVGHLEKFRDYSQVFYY